MAALVAPLRILFIDDVPESVDLLAKMFDLLGYSTQIAHDGIDGIRMAAWFSPQVIFLDLLMPNMDGFALARALRKMPNLENAVMLAVTGLVNITADEQAAAGLDGVLMKPAAIDQMLHAMDTALQARR